MTITSPAVQIPRDRWGRPMVVPPQGGKPVAYTRCTTYVGSLEDTYNLSRWQMRMVALGLADRRDLQLAVAAHREDKETLNEVCEQALDAAQGRAAATTGTALHAITETHDRGRDVGALPDAARADLDAYVEATAGLTAVQIEQFTVLDTLKIGGTPDRVVRLGGKRYIADLKTGSLDYGYMKIAAQLAVYARSVPYDPERGRLEPHGAEVDRGIVIHLPAGAATCSLLWVDLVEGWELVKVARLLRQKRSVPFKDLFTPLVIEPPARPPTLAERIRQSGTAEEVRTLWREHYAEWTDDLTAVAKKHIASLQPVASPVTTASTTPEGASA
jgi:hypothetical protein